MAGDWRTVAFAGLLAAVGGGWMVWHRRSWRHVQQQSPAADELAFAQRQFRRRMWSSGMIAGIGVALVAGEWAEPPLARVAAWTIALALLLATVVLAAIDLAASRQQFIRDSQRDAVVNLTEVSKTIRNRSQRRRRPR